MPVSLMATDVNGISSILELVISQKAFKKKRKKSWHVILY